MGNLAIPIFSITEPQAPKTTVSKIPGGRRKGEEWAWSPWDCIELSDPSLTLKQLVDYFQDEYGLELNMLSYGKYLVLEAMLQDEDFEEVEFPYVRLKLF